MPNDPKSEATFNRSEATLNRSAATFNKRSPQPSGFIQNNHKSRIPHPASRIPYPASRIPLYLTKYRMLHLILPQPTRKIGYRNRRASLTY